MNRQLLDFSQNALFNTWRYESIGDKQYLVVNGVPLVEGVLNGRFVAADQFGDFVKDWDGVPVVFRHPKSNGGSARVPSSDVPTVGRFYNAKLDGTRLIGEYWLEEDLLQSLDGGEDIISTIKNQHPIETSTGYFAESIPQVGQWNGKDFGLVDQKIHPDHIALLPDEIGACSVEDGCGMNRNSEETIWLELDWVDFQVIDNALTKKESWGNEPASSYLVVGDPKEVSTWHLPYKKNGKVDRGLAGAAYAALTKTHRGKAYAGPGKAAALAKLKGIYKANNWPLPGEKSAKKNAAMGDGSLDERLNGIYDAFYAQFEKAANNVPVASSGAYVQRVYDNFLICKAGDQLYKVGYSMGKDGIQFDPKANWQEVIKEERYTLVKQNVTGSLPASGKRLYETVYKSYKDKKMSDAEAAKRAWGAVKAAGWEQDKDGNWHKKDKAKKNNLDIAPEMLEGLASLAAFVAD